jgi:Ni/Co efflux regulator RcnB
LIEKTPYRTFLITLAIVLASLFYLPANIHAQETGGKKLEISEKNSPTKMDNKKIRTSKKRRTKGNPNRRNNKVIVVNPFKWDWGKVMWFKARKSDYETKDYNPNKRPKRKTYDNEPNYESADRDAITNPSELGKPLIPYDSRIAGKGKILRKKRKPKNVNLQKGGPQDSPKLINLNDPSETLSKAPKKERKSKVDGKKLYSRRKDKDRKPFDNDKLETATAPDLDPKMDEDKIMFRKQKNDFAKMNNEKLMVSERPDYKSNKPDGDKLLTVDASEKKPKPFDNNKLMISEPANRERESYDDSKLMTALHGDRERKPFDDDKLMTARPANRERKEYDDSKLMTATIHKPKKQELHDDRLLTVIDRRKPIDEMKETSKDISKFDGDTKRHFYVNNESHPGTKILAAENTKVPFIARTFQSVSSFFTTIWKDDTQPKYVNRKKPKEKRDKKEGMIWDNSVHPDEWKKQEAESGEQQN